MKIWFLSRDQFAHAEPIEAALGREAQWILEAPNQAQLGVHRPDLLLCVNDYPYDVLSCLDAARAAGIPSLVLQDGILEWRCQYQNPLFACGGGAPQHQPVMADKIACLGHQSAEQIAAWGNANKVEVTGMPRLDFLCRRLFSPPRRPGNRILVMTAKNPGFTAEQRERTIESLREVRDYLLFQPNLQVLWRVSKGVAKELGVENQLQQISSLELAVVLEQADAVITTLSTAMLEAMLAGRPVAALDYHNVPRFVPTAWTISARDHIATVVQELLNPPVVKMKFQQDALADVLVCDGRATDRVCELIRRMVAFSKTATSRNPLTWPADLLEQRRSFQVFEQPSLRALYPEQSPFSESNCEELQVRLARAENENTRLRAEIQELRSTGRLGPWLQQMLRTWSGRSR